MVVLPHDIVESATQKRSNGPRFGRPTAILTAYLMAAALTKRRRHYLVGVIAALSLVFAMLVTRRVNAQDAGAPQPLEPPHAINAGTVEYPEGATGEATVLMEVTIDVTGSVRECKLIDGADPFAAAAFAACPKWTFKPATRGGVAVAARVRMLVAFHPPEVTPPPEQDAGPQIVEEDAGAPEHDGGAPPPKLKAQPEDVRVLGE